MIIWGGGGLGCLSQSQKASLHLLATKDIIRGCHFIACFKKPEYNAIRQGGTGDLESLVFCVWYIEIVTALLNHNLVLLP